MKTDNVLVSKEFVDQLIVSCTEALNYLSDLSYTNVYDESGKIKSYIIDSLQKVLLMQEFIDSYNDEYSISDILMKTHKYEFVDDEGNGVEYHFVPEAEAIINYLKYKRK